MPASSPSSLSSKSTFHPLFSAQRIYIRKSRLAQSCASVPPAPALIVNMASASSYSPPSISWISNLSTSFSRIFARANDSEINSSSCISSEISASSSTACQFESFVRFSLISLFSAPNFETLFLSDQISGCCISCSKVVNLFSRPAGSKTLLYFFAARC